MIKYSMGKGPLERRERLHRVCKSIIDNPRNVDAGTVAAFKSAALRFVHTQYDDETEGLEALYHDDGELGSSLRKAVEVIDEAKAAADIAKAERSGPHSLSAALLNHLNDALDRKRERHGYTKSAKEEPMDKTETLRDIAKAGGIIAVAKAIIDENRNYGITEHEFVALATEHAKVAHPELTEAAAFAKLYQVPEVWRACNVLKSMPSVADFTPLVVGGEANRGGDVNPNDPSKAIAELKQLGRDKWPTASEAQQFERALTAPENHALARRAVPIPQATTSFPFPH